MSRFPTILFVSTMLVMACLLLGLGISYVGHYDFDTEEFWCGVAMIPINLTTILLLLKSIKAL